MSKTLVLDRLPDVKLTAPAQSLLDACHVLADQGHAVGLAGQVTLRDGRSNYIWTVGLGVGLEEARERNLILVDESLQVVEGRGKPNPATLFHIWIYRHHPEVNAIIHTHPPALSAFSMLGLPMPVAHMDAAMFFEDCGHLARWPGVPTGDEEGALISSALGRKKSVMLANHGAVCTGDSMQQALYLAVFAERNARICLDALAAGGIQPVEPAAAREAHDFLLQPTIVEATVAYWTRQANRRTQLAESH